ncbi:MAG: hypothetical protein ACI9JM_002516, partial [Halioglobus sp.]
EVVLVLLFWRLERIFVRVFPDSGQSLPSVW